ncbi:hypothetical protein [Moorena sp. SIO3A2]|uniref:hypothetical protein n=1 Tax=Moorena sp. SIO3A2 TaxID=2607841 RepID=UPI0013B630DE|nr:hypothetical protein [Moorena sp. SIO3A2]NER91545.1 hypothetical protein [Moorena sp. SIO3A2]
MVTSMIGLVAFSADKIVENIKFAANRADQQISNYNQLAINLSNYMFRTELVVKFYSKGWTRKSSLEKVGEPYNNAIIQLRKREYVNLALVHRLWGKKSADDFTEIMSLVKQIDDLIHELNTEAGAVVSGKQETANLAVTKPITDNIKPLVKDLESKIRLFLIKLY